MYKLPNGTRRFTVLIFSMTIGFLAAQCIAVSDAAPLLKLSGVMGNSADAGAPVPTWNATERAGAALFRWALDQPLQGGIAASGPTSQPKAR